MLFNDVTREIKKILHPYMGKPITKKAILDCQKELIDKGFAGNAHY